MAYHHGDLRRALLEAAVTVIAESGPVSLSLRDLARRAGVSNAAPTHHFGDKAGLLTALATEGFELLADTLGQVDDGGLLDLGVAYVRFALAHPAHFTVMFQPSLYHFADEGVVAARTRAGDTLVAGVAAARSDPTGTQPSAGDDPAGVAAWSLVHGYATLVLSGSVEADDPVAQARAVARHLAVGPSHPA